MRGLWPNLIPTRFNRKSREAWVKPPPFFASNCANLLDSLDRTTSVRRAVALGQKLIELRLIARVAQSVEEFLKRLLFFIQPPQRFRPVFVESAVAGAPPIALLPHGMPFFPGSPPGFTTLLPIHAAMS